MGSNNLFKDYEQFNVWIFMQPPTRVYGAFSDENVLAVYAVSRGYPVARVHEFSWKTSAYGESMGLPAWARTLQARLAWKHHHEGLAITTRVVQESLEGLP